MNRLKRLRRGVSVGFAGALLVAAGLVAVGLTATPALADTAEPTLFPVRNSSDPEIQQCSDSATGWSGLCMFTSNDLGSAGPWYYPMDKTYLYTLQGSLDPSVPQWEDRGAIFNESQITVPPGGSPAPLGQPGGFVPVGAKHLWAPTHAQFGGEHYLFVPDVTDVAEPGVHNTSRIAIAKSTSLFGPYVYLKTFNINQYASDPAILFNGATPYLVYADGDGDNCGGLSIAQLSSSDITSIVTTPQAITINGLAAAFGAEHQCSSKGRPYLEGAALYSFSAAETGSTNGENYYLVAAVKPEGGTHGASQEVIAYATSSSVTGPYTYRGVIMEASSTEWTNQASIQKYGDHYIFAYHDGTSINGLPARKVRGACLTFQRGLINPIPRTNDGFARCMRTGGTVAIRSRGNGKVVTTGPSAAYLSATSTSIGANERFELVPRPGGRVALRSLRNNQFVKLNDSIDVLRANAPDLSTAGEFALQFNSDGRIVLLNPYGAPVEPAGPNADLVRAWIPSFNPKYGTDLEILPLDAARSLRSLANGRFVIAPNGDQAPLIAQGGTGIDTDWESLFWIEFQSDGTVALKWVLPDRYACAESAGSSSLITNRTAVGLWEKFRLMWNADGTFSLKAAVNDRYVAAENAGASPLIANRTAIGLWESFDIVQNFLVW